MKKTMTLMTSAAIVAAMIVGTAVPASAADWKSGARSCGAHYTFSAANSTASTTHFHEQGAWYKKTTKPAGQGSFKGWKGGGAAWLEISTSGTFRSYGLGCSS